MRVGIHHCQGQVYLPSAREGGDHADVLVGVLDCKRVLLSLVTPLVVPEIGVGQPGLVNVDDIVAIVQHLEELLCIQASQSQVSLFVRQVGDWPDLPVSEAVVSLEHLPDQLLWDLRSILLLSPLLDLPRVEDGLLLL